MLIAYINEAQNPNWQVPRTPGGPDTESRQNSHKNPTKLHPSAKSAAYEIEGQNLILAELSVHDEHFLIQ